MYSNEDLDAAIHAGIMTPQAVDAFRAHVAASRQSSLADEENFRLVAGFNDIFVVIASVLLLGAVGWIELFSLGGSGLLFEALVAWALAGYFVRQRRMALTGIVLLFGFVLGVAMTTQTFHTAINFHFYKDNTASFWRDWWLTSAVTTLAAYMYWRRFRVAAAMAFVAGSAVAFALAILVKVFSPSAAVFSIMAFIAGVAVFAFAMRWDIQDRERKTYRTDVAFWLHLLAAPLLVHPFFYGLGFLDGDVEWFGALIMLGAYIMLAMVSLAVDRRALMVSSLTYVLYAFTSLLKEYGVDGVGYGFAVVSLVLGSALLLLSAFWNKTRELVVRLLPAELREYLAPVKE